MAESHKISSVSFFCPAHNEEANLPVLIPKVHAFLSTISDTFEVVIIENGSTDKTPQIADDLARKFPGVRVLHYPKGLGYGGALREGFRNAKYAYICYTDADNQYDVSEFIDGFKLLESADIASGYVRRKAVSLGRRIQSLVWNLLVKVLFFTNIRDINCSMKIYKRKVLDTIDIESVSAFIDAEMLIKAKHAGFSVAQFPVTHFERTSGKAIGSSGSVIGTTLRDALLFWYRTYRFQVWIFAAAFVARALYALVVFVKAGQGGFIAYSDAEFFYYRMGINLLEHHAFSLAPSAPWYPNAYHTPLYPLFLAGAFALRLPLLAIALLQALCAALSAVLAYNIAKLVSANRILALGVGLLVALEPMSMYWGALLMSDTLFSLITIASLYALFREKYLSSSILLGFAALTRPIALLFLPAFACFAAYRYWQVHASRSGALKIATLILVSFAVIVSPWFVRNNIVFGVWEYTSAGWYDLYITPLSEFALSHGIQKPVVAAVEEERENHFRRFDFAHSDEFKNAILTVVSQDPVGFVAFQLKRAVYALVSNRYEYLAHDVLGHYINKPSLKHLLDFFVAAGGVFWFAVLAFVVFAMQNRKLIPLWLFTAYLLVVNAGISGGINPGGTDMSRYELPFQVLLFTLAGIGASMCASWIKKRFSSTATS